MSTSAVCAHRPRSSETRPSSQASFGGWREGHLHDNKAGYAAPQTPLLWARWLARGLRLSTRCQRSCVIKWFLNSSLWCASRLLCHSRPVLLPKPSAALSPGAGTDLTHMAATSEAREGEASPCMPRRPEASHEDAAAGPPSPCWRRQAEYARCRSHRRGGTAYSAGEGQAVGARAGEEEQKHDEVLALTRRFLEHDSHVKFMLDKLEEVRVRPICPHWFCCVGPLRCRTHVANTRQSGATRHTPSFRQSRFVPAGAVQLPSRRRAGRLPLSEGPHCSGEVRPPHLGLLQH